MRPTNQPTIISVDICHKTVGRPWFRERKPDLSNSDLPYFPCFCRLRAESWTMLSLHNQKVHFVISIFYATVTIAGCYYRQLKKDDADTILSRRISAHHLGKNVTDTYFSSLIAQASKNGKKYELKICGSKIHPLIKRYVPVALRYIYRAALAKIFS